MNNCYKSLLPLPAFALFSTWCHTDHRKEPKDKVCSSSFKINLFSCDLYSAYNEKMQGMQPPKNQTYLIST